MENDKWKNKIIIDNILYEKVEDVEGNEINYTAIDIVDVNNKNLIKFNHILNYNNKKYKLYAIKFEVFKQCFNHNISFEVDDYLQERFNKEHYLTENYLLINNYPNSYNLVWLDKKTKYIKIDSHVNMKWFYIENENIKPYLKMLYKNKLIIYNTDNQWKILN